MTFIPQTVLALRGSDGVGIEGAIVSAAARPRHARVFSLIFTVLGDSDYHKHKVKQQAASSNAEQYNELGTF